MEPFKNHFNPTLIQLLAQHLGRQDPEFAQEAFVQDATAGLEAMELKQRSTHIAQALRRHLPPELPRAAALLCASLGPVTDEITTGNMEEGACSWMIMPMAEFISLRGLEDFPTSFEALRQLTRRFSAEFAIRPFLAQDQERALALIQPWLQDPCPHVRRLASEGTRPRLPWGLRLSRLVQDPSPMLPLLEALRDDPSPYVRRSVANHLNDISKDHPALVCELAARWLQGASPERAQLVRHACRGLIKAGHQPTLEVLGYGAAQIELLELEILTPEVTLGQHLRFSVTLRSLEPASRDLVLDYAVHHKKANGSTSPKVFKGKTLSIQPGASARWERKHAIKPITTRTYYAGEHKVEILANGVSLGEASFLLHLPPA